MDELAATHADDPHRALLHLYSGRAHLSVGDHQAARQAFQRATTADTPDDIRQAARVYEALSFAEEGRLDDARALIAAHFPSPSQWIAAPDLAEAWLTVSEGRLTAGDAYGALEAIGEAHTAARTMGEEGIVAFASVRAYALAADLPAEDALRAFSDLRGLAQAAAGDARVRALINGDERIQAEALLPSVTESLENSGEHGRATELLRALPGEGSGARVFGAILPLTGPSRRVGRTAMAGVLQAQEAFSPGGGPRLTVVFKDSHSDPKAAARAVEDLDELGVVAIIGPLGGPESIAAATAAAERGLPLISLSVDSLVVTAGAYRLGIDAALEIKIPVERARAHGLHSALIVRPETPFGRAMENLFLTEWTLRGGEVQRTLTYESDAIDLRKLAEEAAPLEIDTVFVADS